MKFKRVDTYDRIKKTGIVYLIYDHWDDYHYCTTFHAYYKNPNSTLVEAIGKVKIGCISLSSKVNQGETRNGYSSYSIKELISTNEFIELTDEFFSLGQDITYYKNVNKIWGDNNTKYYECMKDLAYDIQRFSKLYDIREASLINSLLRTIYKSNIDQFHRVTKGQAELTDYSFTMKYQEQEIDINVTPNSLPPTNIHVLIGRNGVGKTWLLHNIVCGLLKNSGIDVKEIEKSQKYSISSEFSIECPENSFAGIIGLSFSVFDDALSIDIVNEENKKDKEVDDFRKIYRYIGLIKKSKKGKGGNEEFIEKSVSELEGNKRIKSVDELATEFIIALEKISNSENKVDTYLETCKNLNTDQMFYDNGFIEILEKYFEYKRNIRKGYLKENIGTKDQQLHDNYVRRYFKRLSSGHMIIMLSLTMLAESIHEKTIVLIDEPETHLHPPLLSTYIRTLSFLLLRKNAVAIIATHSPIVLQEVPKECVSKISRTAENMFFDNVTLETFATNTDSLTREVFGLEVIKTGFYSLIESELEESFEDTLEKFDGKLGSLGKLLVQSLISQKRDKDEEN